MSPATISSALAPYSPVRRSVRGRATPLQCGAQSEQRRADVAEADALQDAGDTEASLTSSRSVTPRARRALVAIAVVIPTMKSKNGKVRSLGVHPRHGACWSGA
ncbi:MAG: hypothetical protein ACT4P6_13705 [Gemmatimonadaceae bacterium]